MLKKVITAELKATNLLTEEEAKKKASEKKVTEAKNKEPVDDSKVEPKPAN